MMIKKTRLNFVLVTMLLLTLVVVAFVGGSIVVNFHTMHSNIEMQLRNALENSVGGNPTPSGQNGQDNRFDKWLFGNVNFNEKIVHVTYDRTSNTATVYDYGYFDDNETSSLQSICSQIISANKTAGKLSGTTVFYLAKAIGENTCEVVWCNCEIEEALVLRSSGIFACAGVIALLMMFVLTWCLSFKVVKPVEDAFNKQKQFISDASHELKTPITIINANAEVLSEQTGESEWVDNITCQTKRMTSLVNDMLSLSRMEEKKTEQIVKLDMSGIVNSASLSFEAPAYENGKQFTYNIDSGVSIDGVEEDAKKLCNLLIDNAVKYSDKFVLITLKGGSKPYLQIVNDGCTVEKKDSQKLFERFYRGDSSRTRATGGSGLGLAIVKAIAERNKWRIAINCENGGNMEITINF